jgi:phosphatidate cytidylyltransferase
MKKRVLTAVIGIAILLPILFLSGTWFFPVAVAACCNIALFEMLRRLGLARVWAVSLPTYVIATAVPFLIRLSDRGASLSLCAMLSVCAVLYLMGVSVFTHGKITFAQLGEALLACLYIVFGFNAIIYLRDLMGGQYIYLLVFIGAWVTDTFAYFSGVLFGRHKLIPQVSPKKTVEGSIGGTLFCILGFVLFGVILNRFFAFHVDFIALCVSGLLVAIVSQIGDLCMSVIKRERGIKDYGNLFPGHGGMMDRFDSILAVASVLAIICSLTDLITPML